MQKKACKTEMIDEKKKTNKMQILISFFLNRKEKLGKQIYDLKYFSLHHNLFNLIFVSFYKLKNR